MGVRQTVRTATETVQDVGKTVRYEKGRLRTDTQLTLKRPTTEANNVLKSGALVGFGKSNGAQVRYLKYISETSIRYLRDVRQISMLAWFALALNLFVYRLYEPRMAWNPDRSGLEDRLYLL